MKYIGILLLGIAFHFANPEPQGYTVKMSVQEANTWALVTCERCQEPLSPSNPNDGLYGDLLLHGHCATKREKQTEGR